jgi:short-subunit dehydrogenase
MKLKTALVTGASGNLGQEVDQKIYFRRVLRRRDHYSQ